MSFYLKNLSKMRFCQNIRNSGSVKWFNSQKGFGFITPDQEGEDVFVHQSVIKAQGFRSLAEGEKVEYRMITEDSGRTKAVDVTGPNGDFVQGEPRQSFGGGNTGGSGNKRGGNDDFYGDRH